jgi:hypothetical protein
MAINFPDNLVANSTTFFLVDEGQIRGTARSITQFTNGALATAFPNNARVKVGSLAIATDTNVVYVCTNVANYNLTTGWTSISGTSLTAGQLIDITSGVVSFDKNGSVTGGQTSVNVSAGNSFRFQVNDAVTPTLILKGNDLNLGSWAHLRLHPENTGSSYIAYIHNSLFFRANTTDVAEILQGGNALFYNSVAIGSSSSTITAILDVRQTGNTKSNLRLVGVASGDNAKLDFAPSGAGESFINATSGKFYFQTGGVGTTYYDSTQWYFTLATAIQPILSASGTALTINPTYASSSNGILIGGSSSNATTRSLSITTALTGATSNAVSITSSVTSVSALGRVVNISPTLVASANSDVLQTYFLNPTFTNSTFSNVKNYSLYSNNGAIYFDAGTQVGSNDGGVTQNTPYPFFYLNGTWSNISPLTPALAQGMILNFTSTGVSQPTNTSPLFQVIYNSISLFSITLIALNLGNLSVGGSLTINTPATTTFSTFGSASTFTISLGNNRMFNASSSGSANTGTTFKNFSHSHTSGTGSPPNVGTYTTLLLQDTYNFAPSGSGSPIARSLYINPTYTPNATGSIYRAIEVTNGDIAFNTTSGKTFMGGTSAVSSTTTACLVISKQSDQAQVNFNPLTSAIVGAVLGDIWFDSSSYNLWMTQKDFANNTTNFKFLTYFNSSFTGAMVTPSVTNGISGALLSDKVLLEPDLWIEINNAGVVYYLPCYTNP